MTRLSSSNLPASPYSCVAPPVFEEFGKRLAFAKTERVAQDGLDITQDDLMTTPKVLSSRQITSLFASGFATAIAGGWALKGLRQSLAKSGVKKLPTDLNAAEALKVDSPKLFQNQSGVTNERNVAMSFDPFSSIYRLVMSDASQRPALLGYVGTSIMGFLGANAGRGVQETWVRREETKIRAHLIQKIQDVFADSIQKKQSIDASLKEQTEKRLLTSLLKVGIPFEHAEALLSDSLMTVAGLSDSKEIQRHMLVEPTHRSFSIGNPFSQNLRFRGTDSAYHLDHKLPKSFWKASVFGIGAMAGLAVKGFVHLFSAQHGSGQFNGNTIVYETIQLRDPESWWIKSLGSRKNMALFGGFLLMSAAARGGQMLLNGLREIEVTRQNARTEYLYQRHNWLVQDPAFHQIAEEQALNESIKQFNQKLPTLKNNYPELQRQIQTILSNIGRNSAPKYFPMTPMVSLVDARG